MIFSFLLPPITKGTLRPLGSWNSVTVGQSPSVLLSDCLFRPFALMHLPVLHLYPQSLGKPFYTWPLQKTAIQSAVPPKVAIWDFFLIIKNFLFYVEIQPINSVVIVSGKQQRDSAIHLHICILPQTPLPSRLPRNVEQSSLCYAVGPCWLSILNIVVCIC